MMIRFLVYYMLMFYYRHVGIQGRIMGSETYEYNKTTDMTFCILQHEGWDTNVEAPSILTEAGIPVALKSDHPVTDAVSIESSALYDQ